MDEGTTELTINFLDPLRLALIQDPVRGPRCRHVQPLDRATLEVNKPCPLCGQPIDEILQDYAAQAIMKCFEGKKVKSVTIDTRTFTFTAVDYCDEQESSSDWF